MIASEYKSELNLQKSPYISPLRGVYCGDVALQRHCTVYAPFCPVPVPDMENLFELTLLDCEPLPLEQINSA